MVVKFPVKVLGRVEIVGYIDLEICQLRSQKVVQHSRTGAATHFQHVGMKGLGASMSGMKHRKVRKF